MSGSGSGWIPPRGDNFGVEEEEGASAPLSSDERSLYLVNIFMVHTARFLNNFSALCQDKLAHLHRRMVGLDASLSILEAELRSLEDDHDSHSAGPSNK